VGAAQRGALSHVLFYPDDGWEPHTEALFHSYFFTYLIDFTSGLINFIKLVAKAPPREESWEDGTQVSFTPLIIPAAAN
jgi:hypothetical protein